MAAKDYIVVDVGASNIKLLEANYQKDKITVKNFSVIPTPINAFENGNILKPDLISDSIRQELASGGFKAKGAVTVITGDAIISREVLLPKMTEKELKNVIMFEADQHFPVDLSNYMVDFKVIETLSSPDGDKCQVFIVAVPKEMIDGYVNLIRSCGLNVEVIDIAGNAVTKLVELVCKAEGRDKSASLAVIDIGASDSRVVIIDNGKFRFERIIKTGVNDIISIVMEGLNMKFREAEEFIKKKFEQYVKLEESYLEEEDKLIEKDIKNLLNGFCNQISKLLEFYYSRGAGKVINGLVLIGGGVKLKGMDKFIADNIGIKVQSLALTSCVENKSAKNIQEAEAFLANAFGAVIRTN